MSGALQLLPGLGLFLQIFHNYSKISQENATQGNTTTIYENHQATRLTIEHLSKPQVGEAVDS